MADSKWSQENNLFIFVNEDIFIHFDELDALERTNQAWIGFNYSLMEAQKNILV